MKASGMNHSGRRGVRIDEVAAEKQTGKRVFPRSDCKTKGKEKALTSEDSSESDSDSVGSHEMRPGFDGGNVNCTGESSKTVHGTGFTESPKQTAETNARGTMDREEHNRPVVDEDQPTLQKVRSATPKKYSRRKKQRVT